MDNTLLKDLFGRARDQHRNARRFAVIAVLFLAAFHFVTFRPYVRLSRELAENSAETARLTRLNDSLAELHNRMQAMFESINASLAGHLDKMRVGLVSDFHALDVAAARIRNNTGLPEPDPERDATQTSPDSPGQQEFTFDDALKEQLAANSSRPLHVILAPVIEEQIIHHRFKALNDFWQENVVPDASGRCKSLIDKLREQEPLLPDDDELWRETLGGVEKTLELIQTMKFEQPGEKAWWASRLNKDRSLQAIAEVVDRELHLLSDPEGDTDLKRHVEEALANRQKLEMELVQALKNLETSFKEQQASLTFFGRPFEFLSLEVQVAVSVFPLVLGLILAWTLFWPAYRLRELMWTVDRLVEKGEDRSLWDWLLLRVRSLSALLQSSPKEGERPSSGRPAWLGRVLPEVLCCLVYCVWIVAVAWELHGWEGVGGAAAAYAAAGCLVVLLA